MDTVSLLLQLSSQARRAGRAAYLVGGCVRDLLLHRPVKDFDVALEGEAFAWAREVAERTGASFVPLDEERDIARVVFKNQSGNPSVQVDVVPLGGTIEENLAQRDLTINAMALPLHQGAIVDPLTPFLIDPCGGLSDLCARLIRVVSSQALVDDPLRLLRVIRFAAKLQFDIEKNTWHAVCQYAPLLLRVAAERIRDEFFAVLETRPCLPYLRLMYDAGLLGVMLPELSAPAAAERGLQAVACAERWIVELKGKPVRETLLKFAALFSPALSGAMAAEAIGQKFRLSHKESRLLLLMSLHHEKPRHIVASGDATKRTRRRFFRVVGDAAVEVLLLSLSVSEKPNEALTDLVNEMLHEYFEGAPTAHPTRFLRGDAIMARYNLPAGPRIRELLEAIEEAEAEGEVKDTEQAWQWLDEIIGQRT